MAAEFSKKLVTCFLGVFAFSTLVFLISALFDIGNCQAIKEFYTGSLAFYGIVFSGYTAKAGVENWSKGKNNLALALEQYKTIENAIECDTETTETQNNG